MQALRILILEDDALLGLCLADMLIAMGYDVCGIEATEAKAIAAANQHEPDLMIVDARLRGSSGLVAVDKILCGSSIPHLFVSGDVESVHEAKPGAIVLQKPFSELQLAAAIHRATKVLANR